MVRFSHEFLGPAPCGARFDAESKIAEIKGWDRYLKQMWAGSKICNTRVHPDEFIHDHNGEISMDARHCMGWE